MEINIKPDIITWAIARAGYEFKDFVMQFPYIKDWLEDKKQPTVKQLEKFSHKVHVPFGYLLLPEPPIERLPIPFFRTNQKERRNENVSVNVYDTIMLIQQRQDWLREYLKENDYEQLSFVGKFANSHNITAIVSDIRQTLGLENEWASSFQRLETAIDHLTQKIEDAGIILTFNGVVENNTSRPIKVNECRGFVLVDRIAPFMFVNNADGKAAQLFTIVHELAHIWTGHSAAFDFKQLMPANDPVELLCDKVAAEFLVPEASFLRIWNHRPEIPYVAKHFKVSQIVIARRALDLGKISKTSFFNFYNSYINQEQYRKESQAGGGDFYANTKKRLSLSFAARIHQAVMSNQLLYRDAYKLTSLKGDTFKKFFDKHF
ncbi:MAG: ImmA/IrrE family metallo-endopeptidase [Bacteroidota bacterium]